MNTHDQMMAAGEAIEKLKVENAALVKLLEKHQYSDNEEGCRECGGNPCAANCEIDNAKKGKP